MTSSSTTKADAAERPQQRVVSLLGAATETLYRLGLGDTLVGRSHECDYPPAALLLPCISQARLDVTAPSSEIDASVRALSASGEPVYELDREGLEKLGAPDGRALDLIIAQDHCRVCAITPADLVKTAETCSILNAKQLILRPSTLQDCLENITQIADAMGVPQRGIRLRKTLDERINRVKTVVHELSSMTTQPTRSPPRVALLEWCDPIMGCGYWLPELVEIAGGKALHCPPPGGATPSITFESLLESQPDVVVFALCGFGLTRAALEITKSWRPEQLEQLAKRVGKDRIFVVDGNYLVNRSGPRLVESCEALAEAIHPELQGHFNMYGTDHLCTLEVAVAMEKAGLSTGSPMKAQVYSSGAAPKERSVEEDKQDNPSYVQEALHIPAIGPTGSVSKQLDHLRSNNMLEAFGMNSKANQHRWCTSGRFAQVIKTHDIFRQLLLPESKDTVRVQNEQIRNGIATVDVCLSAETNGAAGATMVWTLVLEKVDSGDQEVAWRTEKVGF